ncbi:MAG: hypothetical protein JO370_13235 [Paucibacter sp.]|nr:hypothetical protein [Roseateles sp.]
MPISAWLNAGLTGSDGTVEEPCDFTQKFSRASVLIDHCRRGLRAKATQLRWQGPCPGNSAQQCTLASLN